MKYQIVTGDSHDEFEEEVNAMLLADWEPVGGVAVSRTITGSVEFFQAMVKQD